jgi:tetratricopeptide (TPR) repeat protein
VTQLATQCCRLPLALRVAAELAVRRPDTPLADLAGELAGLQRRLDALAAGGDERTAVRAVLSWSYQNLDPEVARTFCLAGLHPGQDFDHRAIAALTGTTPEAASRRADQMTRAYLIQPAGPGRYNMHDLLRGYAQELAAAEHGEEQQRAALTRLFDYYLRTINLATHTLFPARIQRPQASPPDATSAPVTDPAAARAWLDSEAGNICATVAHMAEHGWPGRATRLADAVFPYLESFGRAPEAITTTSRALAAAYSTGDRSAAGTALGNLGYVCLLQGRYQQAASHLRQAVTLSRESGDQAGEATALSNLAVADRRQGRYQQATSRQQQALALYRSAGHQWGATMALTRLGVVESQQGQHQQATEHLREADTLARQIGDQTGQAQALTQLGIVESRQGHHEQAARHHQQAVPLFRRNDDPLGEAKALNGLGEAMLAMSHPGQARTHHTDALTMAWQTGDQDQQARAHRGLARSYLATGQHDHARQHLREALTIYTALSAPEAERIHAELHACQAGYGAS